MLKSTYVPSAGRLQPLPPGWTEHKAPTGHTYYYNAETKESTYTRPGAAPPPANPMASYQQHQAVPHINLSNPAAANAFMAQYGQQASQQNQGGSRGGFAGRGRGGFESRPRPQPVDKPRAKAPIPGCEPWILVYTKYGRRFAYNPEKNASYWRIPDKLKAGILELDQMRILEKAKGVSGEEKEKEDTKALEPKENKPELVEDEPGFDSSEYEEVEVTDDEGEVDEDGNPSKRQRTEEPGEDDQPVEFTEDDFAAQLAAMEGQFEENPDEYEGEWPAAEDEAPLSDEDARELFKDLLDDFKINPYSPWDKLIEEGKIFDDPRYSVLGTMRARRDTWEEWSRAKITELKAQRAREEEKDPRIAYIAFLQEKATPKLFWPEFRRKYKKEPPMKEAKLSDKDREKWYREHINRLKMPQSTLKSDLKKLLESAPLSLLNRDTAITALPAVITTDLRFISLDPKVRDPFIEAYTDGLDPAPEDGARQEEEDATAKAAKEERRRREKAMQERERAVAQEKLRQDKKLAYSRARLRDEEHEIKLAMQVGKKGLQSQLANEK